MTKEQEKQRDESRKQWLDRLDLYIKYTKLPHDDENFFHPSELVELIYDIPNYDITEEDRKKYLKKLGVKV